MNLIKASLIMAISSLVTIKAADVLFSQLSYGISDGFVSLSRERSIVLREYSPNQKANIFAGPDYIQSTSALESQKVLLTIDENGFISTGNERDDFSGDDVISILFAGGSTTEALYVPELSRFPSVVERQLSEQSNSRVRAFNAGVSGNHSMHSVLNLIGKGIELEPDYAVLMHNINDLAVLTKTGSYWIAPHSRSIIQTENLEGEFNLIVIVRALKNYFLPHLYSYLKPRLFPSSGAVADEFEQIGLSWKEINRTGIQEQFKDSLVSFVLLCRVWDIEPILMTQFNRINKDDPAFQFWFEKIKDRGLKEDEFISEYNGFNDIIRQVASEHNVLLIDLAKLVPSTSTYLYDVVHLTEEGSKLVGEIFVDAFLKR